MRSLLPVSLILAAVGCAAPHDDAEGSGADLSATSDLGAGCSAPVRSEDGVYALLDLCPKDGAAGRVVRLELATGATRDVTTYPAADRIERLSSKGTHFFFAVRHAVDRVGRATAGIDVNVQDWSLTRSRTIPTAPPSGVAGTFRELETLMLSADGAHVAYSGADDALASYLFVAGVEGDGAPAGLDLGVPSDELWWSTSGASFVGHQADADGAGETLFLVDAGGEAAATLAAKPHASLVSFAFGQGGTRAQEPFDGTRVVGFKKNADGTSSVGTVDPRSGEETILDTAPVLSIVSDLGTDILYTRITDDGGAAKRELVKRPRAGGDETILVTKTAEAQGELSYGFDPLALAAGGKVGVFQTREGSQTVLSVVKLDGSGADALTKIRVGEQVGSKVLLEDLPDGGEQATFEVLDLLTGERTTVGPSSRKPSVLAGSGQVYQLETCRTAEGASGLSVVQVVAAGDPVVQPCAKMPWAVTPVAAPNSGAVVFYSSSGRFPDYRYDVGVVKPD